MSVTCTVRRISRRPAGPPSPSEWASIICTGVSIVAVFVTGSARRADAGQPEDARGLPAWTPRRQVRALAGGSLSVWRRLDSALCRWSGVPWPSPFVTALGWRLGQRREKWFTELAEGVEKLRERADGFDLEKLAGSDLFVDAVVTTTRTIEHTRQAEKIDALRNAVLNSVAAGASRRGHSGHLPEPGRPLHALTSAAPDAVERSPGMVRVARPDPAGGRNGRQQDADGGSRPGRDEGAEGLLPAHRQRTWLSRDAYGQPVGERLRRIADGPAHDGFRQAVREVHQRPGE